MLINNQIAAGEYRHNYVRFAFVVGTLLLFIGHVAINQLSNHGNNPLFANATLRTEDMVINDVAPSDWVYRSLDALNSLWQLAWLLYSLTYLYRRTAGGYLYLSPKTFTLTFYTVFILGFLVQTIWLLFFYQTYIIWTWVIYFISFLLLSFSLFIVNNNLSVNKKIYETEGLNRDVWCLRFFAQNGVAFFACWTALRFLLAFDTFLQIKWALTVASAGTITLVLAGLLAGIFFFGPNFNAAVTETCAYQFSPWFVFIIFFWGVVENNWVAQNATRNNIIAAVELGVSILAAIAALALFTIRYRTSKIDPIP